MAREVQCPVGSRWKPNSGSERVFVVIERKPFGKLETQEEGRLYFGETRQSDFLKSFTRIKDCQ